MLVCIVESLPVVKSARLKCRFLNTFPFFTPAQLDGACYFGLKCHFRKVKLSACHILLVFGGKFSFNVACMCHLL